MRAGQVFRSAMTKAWCYNAQLNVKNSYFQNTVEISK